MGFECRKGGSLRDKRREEGIDMESMKVCKIPGHGSIWPCNMHDCWKKPLPDLPIPCRQHFGSFLEFPTYSGLWTSKSMWNSWLPSPDSTLLTKVCEQHPGKWTFIRGVFIWPEKGSWTGKRIDLAFLSFFNFFFLKKIIFVFIAYLWLFNKVVT